MRRVGAPGAVRRAGAMAVSHFVHGKHGAYQMAIWPMFQLYGLAWCAGPYTGAMQRHAPPCQGAGAPSSLHVTTMAALALNPGGLRGDQVTR